MQKDLIRLIDTVISTKPSPALEIRVPAAATSRAVPGDGIIVSERGWLLAPPPLDQIAAITAPPELLMHPHLLQLPLMLPR